MISYARLVVAAGAAYSLPMFGLMGQEPTTPAPVVTPAPAVTQPAPAAAVKLPYGVDDVLKLSRSSINEDIILNYIQNSGTIYNLAPQDIVYLRNQGVSDRVVGAMLNQRKQVEAAAAQSAPQNAPAIPNAPMVPDANTAQVAPVYDDSAQQTAAPSSSVYVIPYPQATAAYYGSYGYPYYSYPYYGSYYYGPSIAFGFGFGHGGYCGPRYYHGSSHAFAHGGGHVHSGHH